MRQGLGRPSAGGLEEADRLKLEPWSWTPWGRGYHEERLDQLLVDVLLDVR